MQWLLSEAERGVSRQRYKGLGEMNPEQLLETTLDATLRRLLQRADRRRRSPRTRSLPTLMGDEVEPRRKFIESECVGGAEY